MKDLFLSRGGLFSRIFLLVIIAPLTEELLMRGIILRGLLSWHRPAVAVVLAAFLFAVLHLNPWQFCSALFLGTVFGWFYWRTGSVWICVLAHAWANGLFQIASSLPVEIPGMTGTPDLSRTEFQPWWLDLCGLALLLAGIWAFRRATLVPELEPAQIPPVIGADNSSSPTLNAASDGAATGHTGEVP